jgi:hypothetical protein
MLLAPLDGQIEGAGSVVPEEIDSVFKADKQHREVIPTKGALAVVYDPIL